MMEVVSEPGDGNESFEERVRAMAREVTRSVERLAELDVEGIARAMGVDAERARELADTAGRWFSAHADTVADEVVSGIARHQPEPADSRTRRGAGPHPLDVPTEDQGLALSALDSGRWTVAPGSAEIEAHGDGRAPSNALGLVGELRARDWIDAAGGVTLVGRSALRRWLDAADGDSP
jgi:hypothetical protein